MIDTDTAEPTLPTLAKVTEIKDRAEEIKAKRALPAKPGDMVRFSDMIDWFKLLSSDMESRLIVYVYRLKPVIIRQQANPDADNSIDVISDSFSSLTEQSIIEKHGGGHYQFLIKDVDNPRPAKGGFFQARLQVDMNMNPPNLELTEVVWDHKENKGYRAWCRTKGLITENNVPVIQSKETNAKPSGDESSMVAAMKLMLDFTKNMKDSEQRDLKRQLGGDEAISKTMSDIFIEKMKQDDPSKLINTIIAFSSANKPDSGMGTMIPLLTQMMNNSVESSKAQLAMFMESSKQQTMMMMEMFKVQQTNTGGGGAKSGITEMREAFELFSELGGSGGKKSTAEVVAGMVSDNLTPVLQIVGNIIAMKAGEKAQVIPPKPTVVTEAPQQTQQVPVTETNPMIQTNELVNVLRQFGPMIISNLSKEGWEVADGAARLLPNGDMLIASIIKHGVDGILIAAKQIPEMWNQVESTYGEPHLRKWLDEFCRYKEIVAEMEASEGEIG